MCFSLWKDIHNHKYICCFSFFNNSSVFFMINIYSDNNHSALKYLKDTEANIHNVLIMTGDFNIRNSDWDLLYPFHSSYSDSLVEIADSLNLTLISFTQQIFTWYSDNRNNSNSVINLFFLQSNSLELNNHKIHPELWFPSDHALLTINIIIEEEFIQNKRCTIIKNSEEKFEFVNNFMRRFRNINIANIVDKNSLESIVQEYVNISELTWVLYSQLVNITR